MGDGVVAPCPAGRRLKRNAGTLANTAVGHADAQWMLEFEHP
jgi:hypothetical protein